MSMKKYARVALAILCVLLWGCDKNVAKAPPIAVTFRQGLLSKLVLQVSNLSTVEGIEVYVYVANDRESVRSGNTVIPANGKCEFGTLELGWQFDKGDYGFVNPVRHGKKLFFMIEEEGSYKTWFGVDDIPEADVRAKVRALAEERRLAKITADIQAMRKEAVNIYTTITNANTIRMSGRKGGVWPKVKDKVPFAGRTKAKLAEWKDKIAEKFGKSDASKAKGDLIDMSDMRFADSREYFSSLFAGKEDISVNTNWSIIAEYTSSMSPLIPVLVSANLPCKRLCAMWDGNEGKNEVIPLQNVCTLGTNAVVVVYGNGDVRTLNTEDVTLEGIYGRAFNTYTNGYNSSIKYLTPDGVVGIEAPTMK